MESTAKFTAESGDQSGHNLLQIWSLSRIVPTKIIDVNTYDDSMVNIPSFSVMCSVRAQKQKANNIGYLPLIPSSPTNPGVVKKALLQMQCLADKVGMSHTIVNCDLAVYEIAYTLRKEYSQEFSNVILQLGGFYRCYNFIHAIAKIIRVAELKHFWHQVEFVWRVQPTTYLGNRVTVISACMQ